MNESSTLFHRTYGSTKYNKLNKTNEHNILRQKKVNTKFTSVTACHTSHDIIDYLMHRVY